MSDLDEQELRATRILNGVDKKCKQMNIEEAISNLIGFIDFYNKKPKEENRKFKMLQVDNIDINAIETLLTAYEKEKEKNKKARYYIYDALNNDDITNVGIDDIKIILDMLEE